MWNRSLFALCSLALTSSLAAQSIIETPTSTIEIMGLKRWTLRMIQDSLAVYAPGDSLTGHACAAPQDSARIHYRTNLFAFDGTLRVLAATSVSPSLAAPLLAGGGAIVRAKLHSRNTWSKNDALAFLSQLSGLRATSDVAAFERWMHELPAR